MKTIAIIFISLFVFEFSYSQNHTKKITSNRIIVENKFKYGLIDTLGKLIIPIKYDFIEFKNNRLIIRKNKLSGIHTLDNEELIPLNFKYVLPRNNGSFLIWTNNNIQGIVDSNGKEIIPIKYEHISTEKDDYYFTTNSKKLNGVYDYHGLNIINEDYQFFTIDNYKIFAIKDNKPLILDILNPKNLIYLNDKIKFINTIRHYSFGEKFYQIIKKENRYGVINSNNEFVIPLMYDEIKSSENWEYFIVKSKGKFGIVNTEGKIIINPIYDDIIFHDEYVTLIQRNKKKEAYSYGSEK